MKKNYNSISGYKIKNRKGLNNWSALLEEWILCVERYSRITNGDSPYAYNERANIGLLAGAAWRCGRTALEETQSEKGYINKPKWTGRIDLWLADELGEEIIEAKFKWLSLKSRNSIYDNVCEIMDIAVTDAKKSGNTYDAKSLGIGFFPVHVQDKYSNNIDNLIHEFLTEVYDVPYHGLAWCFPRETRDDVKDNGYIHPGVVMVVNNIKYS